MQRFCVVLPSAAALCLVSFFTPIAHSQMPVSTSTTSTPVPGAGHDYLGEIGETVNPVNGSVSIRLNAMMPPGRGLTLPFSFAYDSNGVNYVGHPFGSPALGWLVPPTTLTSQGGWSNGAPVVSVNEITWTATSYSGHQNGCWAFVNYVYQDANGNRHNLNLTTYNQAGNQNGACTYDSSDWPFGFSAEVVTQGGEAGPNQGAVVASINSNGATPGPIIVSHPDGTALYFPNVSVDANGTMATSVEDRNGNIVTINPPVYPATSYSYVDTTGRTVLQDTGFAVSPETVTVSGLNAPYTLQWTSLSTPSFVAPVTTLSGTCNFGGSHQLWSSQHGLSSLTLPNGKAFSFTYDPTYGLVNKITYPTGGYIRYVWGLNPQAEYGQDAGNPQGLVCTALYGVPAITDRYVSFNGSSEVLHQHFIYTTSWNGNEFTGWLSKQTTVTTTDNVRNTSYSTVYTYSRLPADVPPNSAGGPTQWDPVEASIAYSDTNGALLTVSKTWTTPRTMTSQTNTYYPTRQASETVWVYNSREMPTQQGDYDFGPGGVGPLLRKTVTNYQQFANTAIVDRPCQVITDDSTGTNRVAETDYFYDNGVTTTPCGAAGTPSVASAGGSSLTGHDETLYSASSTYPRGNLTQRTQWLNTGASPVTTYAYDETGQVLSMTDPNSHTTTYSYTDSYLNTNSGGYTTTAGSPPSGKVTNAYLTQTTRPPTSGVAHVTKFAYGYDDGELTQTTDENSQPTTYRYNDSLGRLTETDYPVGQTTLGYNDSVPSVTTTKLINSSLSMSTTTTLDGLNHAVESQLTTDPSGTTSTAKAYDGLGRAYESWNPTRCSPPMTNCGETTWGYGTYNYDGLSRVTSVVEQDGSTVSTNYAGFPCTTVTDEAGKIRKSCIDGLGRLTGVWEDPNNFNYETDYHYDALNELTQVTQGSETRSFSYDSLSRLLSATNPESGGTAYSYDNNGNLLSRTDARGVSTTYSYDGLNRLTQKLYSDGTSRAGYVYDQNSVWGNSLSNTIGRLSQEAVGVAQRVFSYDPMGRLANQWECLPSNCGQSSYNTSMLYDLAGDLTQLTYPSGRVISNTYNSAQRVIQVALTKANGQSLTYLYASGLQYAPNGALNVSTIGNNSSTALTETYGYNNRLQMASESIVSPDVNVMNHNYGFVAGQNNGNVPSIVDQLASSRTQTLGYDSLNRLSSAVETAWGLGFVYDRYSNLLQQNVTLGSAPAFSAAANTKNQLVGYGYDLSGNMISDVTHTYQYDAESRLKTLDGGSAAYAYDAHDNRIIKVWSDTAEYIVANGQTLSEHHSSNWNDWSDLVYLNGRLLAKADSYEDRILITGSNPGSGYSLFAFSGYSGYVMRSGDKLFLRQYQSTGSYGGMQIAFTDGTNTNWNATDSDGQVINNDGTQQSWHYRRIDLSAFAGKTINAIYLDQESSTTASPWSIYYTDIALVSADGTVRPLYNRETSISLSHSGTSTGTASVNHASSESQIPDVTTTFYHGDHLGSSREMSSVNGYPVWQATYLPFGYEYNPQGTVSNYKFTGKERDAESGLDNFEARYMGSSLGRFMTPDPSNLSVDFWLPQTWNRYAYAVNNPLRFVDRNGLWPTEIHNQIISEAFPGLSADQIKTLQQASHDTDYGNINVQDNNGSVVSLSSQDPIVSYVHGMSDGTIEEDPGEAQKLGDAFIAQNEHGAEQAQADWIAAGNSGISPKALTAFGNALHTVTDRTSPAHSGNKPWYGWMNPLASGMHVLREHWISQSQKNAAIAAAQNAYLNTFGWMALMNATQQPKACVEAHDSSGQGTGTTCN